MRDKWVKKMWYIYVMEYYSAIKKNKFESVLVKWINQNPVIQSEVSQKERNTYTWNLEEISCVKR